jgi:predicted nucleic acid-binding protein
MVIADTSVWIPFFNRPDSSEKASLDTLIDADDVVLVGVVVAELLQGCRTASERALLSGAMSALPYRETQLNLRSL